MPALAKSSCSSTASVKPASNGQAIPAASQRCSVNRTVDDATPTRRAISRAEIPALFNLRHSRTWRIDILSLGIGTLLGKAERADPKEAGRGASPRAISFRNHGRFEIGMMGDFARKQHRGETCGSFLS